jgi:hypothetical protein
MVKVSLESGLDAVQTSAVVHGLPPRTTRSAAKTFRVGRRASGGDNRPNLEPRPEPRPARDSDPAQISLEWTMFSNWRHRATTRNAEPANANQNGAVIPNCFARRPPIGVPITIPPMIATR